MSYRLRRALAAVLYALAPAITLAWFLAILAFVAWLGH
ncbi:hypothetical protein ANOBCDAF_00419 [Pleomorphomonas sp. T1.2MG-36]|nr:hypothetical protein ANOBCDAF_00419 [Pleomorphomonas sp. T1.2MG-36]